MRPVLMLFLGTRGGRAADTVAPLLRVADVVVATSADILAERVDSLDGMPGLRDLVVARGREELLERSLGYAREHPVDGALTMSDDLVASTAAFSAACGLPGQPPATIAGFRDKFEQRSALAAAGLPGPSFALVTEPGQAEDALAAVPLPAILKPTRGSGGALAYVITEPGQLAPVLGEAFASAAAAGGAVEEDTAFLLEELLIGVSAHPVPGFAPYVSVESVAVGGRITSLAVTDRFPVAPPALETGLVLPSCLPPTHQGQAVAMAEAALRALGFCHGIAHTELMLTADGPRIIEVNARAGGSLPYLFPMASTLDLVETAGRIALGRPPGDPPRFSGHAVFVAPHHPVGVQVERVEGLDDVAALPDVRAVIPLSTGGQSTESFRQTLIAAVLGHTATPAAAVRLWRDVLRLVRPVYAGGDVAEHHRRTPGTPDAPALAAAGSPS